MGDPLERMRVDQLAKELLEPSFTDAEVLRAHPITVEIGAQLYTAVGSIAANIREGYYRSPGKDRIQRMLKAIIPRERDRLIRPHREPV